MTRKRFLDVCELIGETRENAAIAWLEARGDVDFAVGLLVKDGNMTEYWIPSTGFTPENHDSDRWRHYLWGCAEFNGYCLTPAVVPQENSEELYRV